MPIYVKDWRTRWQASYKSLNFMLEKGTLLIVFGLNPTCLRVEINGGLVLVLMYLFHGKVKDRAKVKIVNCHVES